MHVAYCRVSSKDQNLERQIEALKKYDIEKWYTEKVSGKDMEREQFKIMMDFVREGDVIYIHDFSRLARSLADLLSIIQKLDEKKVGLVCNKENVDTKTELGHLMVGILGAVYEFERVNGKERQREGIERAKERGVYKGRKKKAVPGFQEAYQRYKDRQISKAAMARELQISRPTLNKLISEMA